MKKLIALPFLLLSVSLFAQEHSIKINPLSLLFSTGNLSYEKKLSENKSFQMGIFYLGLKSGEFKYSGIGITPEYRFYIAGAKQALNGIYAAPYMRYQNHSIKDSDSGENYKYSSIGGGGVMGWQKSYNSGFVLNIFAGFGYNAGKVHGSDGEKAPDLLFGIDRFGTRAGLTLGFWF